MLDHHTRCACNLSARHALPVGAEPRAAPGQRRGQGSSGKPAHALQRRRRAVQASPYQQILVHDESVHHMEDVDRARASSAAVRLHPVGKRASRRGAGGRRGIHSNHGDRPPTPDHLMGS